MAPRNKPLKRDRDKNDVENLTLENTRREQAKKRAAKQKEYRTKVANSNEQTNSLQAELQKKKQKERTKLAKKRHAARINHSIKVTQKKEDYGDYLWIDSIPICDMTQLLTNFKTTEFQKMYEKNCTPVSACNPPSRTKERKDVYATYWILNESNGKPIKNNIAHWKNHPHTSETHDIVLSNFMKKIGSGINAELKENNAELKENITFHIMNPGFVQTKIPNHQHLHLDRKDINFQNPGQSYIIHVPLDVEGMQLRLGKFDDKFQLKHGLIHIPFGSGIILYLTQLHAGHYGSPGNFRFHAVLSEDAWDGTYLMQLETYLEKTTEGQEVDKQAILDQFEKDLLECNALGMTTKKGQSLRKTTFYNHLLQFNTCDEFLNLVKRTDKDKKKGSTD